jgi:hypothetical protein
MPWRVPPAMRPARPIRGAPDPARLPLTPRTDAPSSPAPRIRSGVIAHAEPRRGRVTGRLRRTATLALCALAACVPPPPPAPLPPPPPPPAPAGPPPFTATEVWTAQPGLVLRGEGGEVTLPWVFMRLQVLRVDSTQLLVRCLVCRGAPTGLLPRASVVHEVRAPAEAATLELADFVLAVREAARLKDYPALRAMMSRDFVYSLDDPAGVLEAVAGWQGRRTGDLQRLPALLDRGVISAGPGGVWAAPPEFVTQRGYADLRAGFRRGATGWQFMFLVRPGV